MSLIRLLVVLLLTSATSVTLADTTPGKVFNTGKVRLAGRFDSTRKGTVRFTWPGSAVAFRFHGTRAAMDIQAHDRVRFDVSVDHQHHTLWVTPKQHTYTLARNLADKTHEVRVTRLTESFAGVTAFTGGPFTDGKLLARPRAPKHKLLIIGDSISAGYGVEGHSKRCHYSEKTENPLKAYGSVAARLTHAEVHTIAWSGIGAWRSYGEKTPKNPTMLVRRRLTLGTDLDSHWNSARYQPGAIVIALGTNDFWQGTAPGYLPAMKKLVSGVRADYPQAKIYLMVSPMLSGHARKTQKRDVQSLAGKNVTVADLGKILPKDGFGCDYHPDTKTQRRMGERLARKLQKDLGWK